MHTVLRKFSRYGYGNFLTSRKLVMLIIMLGTLIPVERAQAEPITITALGDSLIQGYGLPTEDGFVVQLQNWLVAKEADAVVVNAGVSGDTTAGGASRVEWTLTPDVDALIVSLGGNDVLRGLDPSAAYENLHKIMTVAREKNIPVLLVGISAPANYGADYKADFDAIYPALAAEFETLLYTNFLAKLTSLPDPQNTLMNYFQADALHPNAKGVALVVEDIGGSVLSLIERVEIKENND